VAATTRTLTLRYPPSGTRLEVTDRIEARGMVERGWRVDGPLPGRWIVTLSNGERTIEIDAADASHFGPSTGWRTIGREYRVDAAWLGFG
jgi:hypothetical protein